MIAFKDFLIESRSAPLYHGTNMSALKYIIKVGIEPRTLQNSKKIGIYNYTVRYGGGPDWAVTGDIKYAKGVSTTRNFKFASAWGNGVVLELNQRKLAQRYKIVPFQYFDTVGSRYKEISASKDTTRNEYEEFVITTKPIPFSYVERVYIPDAIMIGSKTAFSTINILTQQYGSSFIRTY